MKMHDGKATHYPPPEEMTVHMLMNDISGIARKEAHAVGESAIDLPHSGRGILFCLCHEDGLTQLDLSDFTHLKPPTISVTLKKMETDGYVVRREDETDRRITRVYVTEKGRAFDNKIREVFRFQDKIISDALTEAEQAKLKELLIKVRGAILASEADPRCGDCNKKG